MRAIFSAFSPHIQEAIRTAFKVQFSTEVSVRVQLGRTFQELPRDCVSQIWFADNKVAGSLVIGFEKPIFLALISDVFGEEMTELNAENSDACGEMMNIVYTTARKQLNLTGHKFELALPKTIAAPNAKVSTEGFSQLPMVMLCSCEYGTFWFCLFLEEKAKKVA